MVLVMEADPVPLRKGLTKSESCIWPRDTIIDKKLLLLELSDPELKAIGIARKGQSIFYHNIVEGLYDWSLTDHPDLIPREDRVTTYNKFVVEYITNSRYEPSGSGEFYASMDTLVPVITNNTSGQIFWFTPHDSFFNLLPGRYSYMKTIYENLICLKKTYPGRTFTNYLNMGTEYILDPIKVLKLSNDELQKTGILIKDESVTFQTAHKKYTLIFSSTGTYSSGNDDDFVLFPPNPYPVIMTDTLGRRLYAEPSIVNADSLSKVTNILVPVRINLNKIVPGNKEVIVCWYYPTEDFLNSLPKSIGSEIKSELNSFKNVPGGVSQTCNYFEVCKSSLNLEEFSLYPNPATSTVTIEFTNAETIIGSISIVNMAGLKVKELVPKTTFLSGKNSFSMSLSGINSGIYLITVKTNRGFKTQRLIVTQ
jgi:hypothetical protein